MPLFFVLISGAFDTGLLKDLSQDGATKFKQAFYANNDEDIEGQIFSFENCQKDDDRELSSEGVSSVAGGIVALGKFDALHIGHRELVIQASKVGAPFLLSFVGMAEVLGWAPRSPIVAKCDRHRILSSWAPFCGNVPPKEFLIDFASVRHLTPQQFVEKLSKELGVRGVVTGENYRFGYKAAGDASQLVKLCDEYGIQAYIINSVMDKNQDMVDSTISDKKERGQVSSTRVRYALSKGDISYVSELLGRQHRVILSAEKKEEFVCSKNRFSAPKSCLLNLLPKDGVYENCSLIVGDGNQLPCRVLIDSTHIHLELDQKDFCVLDAVNNHHLLSIEFWS
ncbi:hypothetical protein SOVF_105810 isoform C [Spinacia oleracea]|nr:hypothetical protein SOVF_105810 isoform C [Spinacia oleracea]